MRMPCPAPRQQTGFNLIELMVVLALVALGAGLGLPGFRAASDRYRATTALSELSATLALARATAISRQQLVIVCPGSAVTGCRTDADWSQGWVAFRSRSPSAPLPAAEDVVRDYPLALPKHLGLRTSAARPRLRFSAQGRSDGSNLTFSFCRGQKSLGQLVINNAGRSRRTDTATSVVCAQ